MGDIMRFSLCVRDYSLAMGLALFFVAGCSRTDSDNQSAANGAVDTDDANAMANGTAGLTSPAADGPDVAQPERPTGPVDFLPTLELGQTGPAITFMLRNGRAVPATSRDWPATFYATFQSGSGSAGCTSALIGPEVMLTAAHCVPETGIVTFKFSGVDYPMRCSRHPNWETGQDPSSDFALCRLNQAFVRPPGFLFEEVDTTPLASMQGTPVVLTGFGCVSDLVTSANVDGKFRIGPNVIEATSLTAPQKYDENYYAAKGGQANNLFTPASGANICPGDSGGPAYRITGAASGGMLHRVIVAVNSRVFYADDSQKRYGASILASLGGRDFRNWAVDWLSKQQLAACGLTGAIPSCRS
jgi:hypothetical protein